MASYYPYLSEYLSDTSRTNTATICEFTVLIDFSLPTTECANPYGSPRREVVILRRSHSPSVVAPSKTTR